MSNEKIIYKKITEKIKKSGYINLNHQVISTKDDFVDLATIFRNPMYETFRVIYMKDNNIVGNEAVSSKLPDRVYVGNLVRHNENKNNMERCFYKVKDRMRRLNANGYYLAHNHPSDNAEPSQLDIKLTKEFAKKVEGFKGHVIVNTDTFGWIDVDKNGNCRTESCKPIKKRKVKEMSKKLEKKSIYDIKINCRQDLINLLHNIKNSKNFSTLIFSDTIGSVRMIMDIPNNYMNMKYEQLKGYLRNLAKQNGASKIFFATSDYDVYDKSTKLFKEGVFTDSVHYTNVNDKTYIYEEFIPRNKKKLFDEKSDIKLATTSLILNRNNAIEVGDKSEVYEINYNKKMNSDECIEIPVKSKKSKIKVLYKKVGEEPKVIEIENTLTAKQKLVDGLIEVVPYNDAVIVCNEEGKILNMKPNVIFDFDYIAGDFFVAGDDYEKGDFKSLTEKEIKEYSEDLKRRSFILSKSKDLESRNSTRERE